MASPVGYPGIIREFSANVSTINSIPLIPQTQSQLGGSGLINVVVNDPFGAGWRVVWSYAGQSYSVSESQSYSWFINPPYVPIQISFTASITQNPGGYTCQIQPSQVTSTYGGVGSAQEFNVTCQQVNNQPPNGGGSSYTVTVYVYAPSGVSWTVYLDQYIAGSIIYIYWWSGTGNGGPYTATVSGSLTYLFTVKNLPSGCTASGSPYGIGQTFTPTGSFTEKITITCTTNNQPPPPPPPTTVYGCFFTLSVGSNPPISGAVSSSPSPPGTYFVQSGSSLSGSISAQSSVSSSSSGSSQSWYQFEYWSLSFSGSGTFYWNGVQISGSWSYGRTSGLFTYDCPSGLTQNVTASFTATANYVYDYITLSGPTSVTLTGPGSGTTTATYTLSWSTWPYNAFQVAWSLAQTGPPRMR